MSAKRYLIVNADDFGLSDGVNRGIIEAHEHGIVTSTSLMVRWPAAIEAAAYGREHPSLSLGLHVDFGEWAYRNGQWIPTYEVAPLDNRTAVVEEAGRQLDRFRELAGGEPTHLDSHQHVHRAEPLRSVLIEVARSLDVPLRHFSSRVAYCGSFYGQLGKGEPFPEAVTVESLMTILAALPAGITELGCHPGIGDEMDSMYGVERARELRSLGDPRVRAALEREQIELRSFREIPHLVSLS